MAKRKIEAKPKVNRGGNKRDNERAARVLAEAHFYGSKLSVAEKHGVPSATYFRWENELENDEQLRVLYGKAKAELERQDWAKDLNAFLRRALARLAELVEKADSSQEVMGAVDKGIAWSERRAVIEIETRAAGQNGVSESSEDRTEAANHHQA